MCFVSRLSEYLLNPHNTAHTCETTTASAISFVCALFSKSNICRDSTVDPSETVYLKTVMHGSSELCNSSTGCVSCKWDTCRVYLRQGRIEIVVLDKKSRAYSIFPIVRTATRNTERTPFSGMLLYFMLYMYICICVYYIPVSRDSVPFVTSLHKGNDCVPSKITLMALFNDE